MKDLNSISLPELFRRLVGDVMSPASLLVRLAELARDEDLGLEGVITGGIKDRMGGDVTSTACIGRHQRGQAVMAAREELRVAGLAVLPTLVEVFGASVEIELCSRDGERVKAGQEIARLRGPMREILGLERTMLNLVSRLSGVATLAAKFVARVEGTGVKIYDTRKTTPGMRVLEKYAVRCGGAYCHRIGLHDAMLIKDNHIAGVGVNELAEFVRSAVQLGLRMMHDAGKELWFVELEVDSLEQLEVILRGGGCGVDVVLLDNMGVEKMRRAVTMRDESGVKIELEASGGVRLETVREIAETGVERISAGAITHQAVGVDIGLDVK